MRLKCITCEALARPVYLCAALSPHIIDVELLPRGLHNQPDDLRSRLQAMIDAVDGKVYDAVIMAYGLCGKATSGLAATNTRLVIPRAHDCITLFLGSRQRYQVEFSEHPGTYWYSQDYIERDDGSGSALSMGSATDTELQSVYQDYVEKYGKDNADYLMQVMGAWQQHYQRAAYIDLGIGDGQAVEAKAQAEAARRGWAFERMTGDLVLVRRLINGDWGEEPGSDFLVLQPGQKAMIALNDDILVCG